MDEARAGWSQVALRLHEPDRCRPVAAGALAGLLTLELRRAK